MAAQDAVVCPADRINSNGRICRASDVQLAVAGVGIVADGLTCFPGESLEIAVKGTVKLRRGARFDIGIWIASDGKPMDLRGGNDSLDPGNVPDEGGAQFCEVMPLPSLGTPADGTLTPNVIDSFDVAATPHDCYDTSAARNGDQVSQIQITTDRDRIVEGRIDVNNDGIADSTDNSGILPIVGYYVYAGLLDMDGNGVGGETTDDGIWNGYAVTDGIVDVNGDGIFGNNDGSDDSLQAFNDSVTLTCLADVNGGMSLESMVTWRVPSDGPPVCDATNPDTYGPVLNSKCSVNTSELAVEIVGVVRVVKSAPAAEVGDQFEFSFTNSSPTFADTNPLVPDISETSPFNLENGQAGLIHAVIGDRVGPGGAFIPAQIVIEETNLSAGWQLDNISCELTEGGTPVNTTVDVAAGTATVELLYNEADPLASQDDVTCTFENAPAPATITVIKNTSGGDDTFDFLWGSTTNTPTTAFQLTTSGGTATTTPPITVTTGLGDTDFTVIEDLNLLQDDWRFLNASCVDEGGQPVGTLESIPPLYGITGITLNAGDDIICTFNNARKGTVNILKETVGGDATFGFSTTLAGSPTFTRQTSGGSSTAESRVVDAGTYTLVEDAVPAGWQFTSVVCTESVTEDSVVVGPQVTLNVQPGETIGCVYTNTADATIIVDKVTLPAGSPVSFTFTPSWDVDFALTDAATPYDSGFLTPGTGYSISETVPDGWVLTSAICSDGSDPGAIDLAPGETVTCTFTNTQNGTITVNKAITIPTGTGPEVEDFSFTGTGPNGYDFGGGFVLSTNVVDADSEIFIDLEPGAYTVNESSPIADGWILAGVSCSGEAYPDPDTNPANITLSAGENVVCTFTNAPSGTMTIIKNSHGNEVDGVLADFDFDFTWGNVTNGNIPEGELADFTLNTFGDGTESRDFTNKLLPLEPYDLAETGLPADVGPYAKTWQLSSVGCDDPSPGSSVPDTSVPGANGSDATIVADSYETVICTFDNTLDGTLVVRKQTANPGDFDQDFTFVGGVSGTVGDVAGTINDFDIDPVGGELSYTAQPGVFGSAETVTAGWKITNIVCEGATNEGAVEIGTAGNFTSPGYDEGDDRVRVDVAAGDTVICTFTNEPFASLTIFKNVAGADAVFNFTGNDTVNDPAIVANFAIDTSGADLDQQVFSNLAPGVYGVAEIPLSGYDLSLIECRGAVDSSVQIGVTDTFIPGDDSITVDLSNGEDVVCTFTNTQQGTIIIDKATDPVGSAQSFEFTPSYGAPFNLTDADAPNNSGLISAGVYSVVETPVSGWDLTSATCSDGSDPASIDLGPGETVTCTFTNTIQRGTIIVDKVTDPAGSLQSFDFVATYGNFSLADGDAPNNSGPLLPSSESSTYSVVETPVPGWNLASATCSDGSDPGAIDLAPGETVTCTFTNTQNPVINLAKVVNGPATLEADGTYTVVYTITATNTGGPGIYNLVDAFSPGDGITLNTADAVYVPGTEVTQTGTLGAYPNFVTNEGLAEDLDESWTVTANFTVNPALVDPATRSCDSETPVVDTGFYNYVSGSDLDVDLTDNDACTGLPDAAINLVKTAAQPVLEADGTYTVVYTITATNSGEGPGMYDMTDTFSPAAGITLDSAELSTYASAADSQTGAVIGGSLPAAFVNGDTIVTGEALAAGNDETWTITANFTVVPADITGDATACVEEAPEAGRGFYNFVDGNIEEDETDNDACVNLPDPAINLVKTAAQPVLEADGTYTVVYTITATNGGEGPGMYDMTDTFSPATGITLDSAELSTYASAADSQTGAVIGGSLPAVFASGDTIVTGESLAAGNDETWTITANFTVVAAEVTGDATACVEDSPVEGTGFFNRVEGNIEEDETDNIACVNLPDPAINLAKTATDAVNVGQDAWEVVYTITATNTGQGPGVYDLIDTLSPGDGITPVIDASYPALAYMGGEVQTGTLATPPLANGGTWLTLESLAAQASETWTITARFTVDLPTLQFSPTNANCEFEDGETGTGYYNFIEGSETDDDFTDNEACVPHLLSTVPVPTLGTMALLLMMLLMIATAGWYLRSGNGRRIS